MEYKLNEYHNGGVSDEELLEDVKRVSSIIGDVYLSISTYKTYGKYGETVFRTHFGSWFNVLKNIGLRTERNQEEMQRIKDQDFINDLLEVKIKLNKNTVTYEEYNNFGNYSGFSIRMRFGSWANFLKKSGIEKQNLLHLLAMKIC
jgi:hypothetical protein